MLKIDLPNYLKNCFFKRAPWALVIREEPLQEIMLNCEK